MKNLVILFVVFFSLFLASCSDVIDNSMVTNPVIEKTTGSGSGEIVPSPIYPYPYLYNFSEVKGVKFESPEGFNSVNFIIPDYEVTFSQFYVVVSFNNLPTTKTYFINLINQNSFKVDGILANQISDVKVYAMRSSVGSEGVTPLQNNTVLNQLAINGWKLDRSKIVVECPAWPSSLKFVYAQITTKENNYFIFLQKPYSNKFIIPEYGKYGVQSVKLFGYHTVTESDIAVE